MNLAIICFGEFGLEVFDLAKHVNDVQKRYRRIVFVDCCDIQEDKRIIKEDIFFQRYSIFDYECVIAVGETEARHRIYQLYKSHGYRFTNLVSPLASVSSTVKLGEGVLIFPFVYVAHEAVIGDNTVLHAHAIVENDCYIGRHCFLSLGCFIGACTKIGDATFVGPNASLRDKIKIGNFCILGMGTVVIGNVDDKLVLVGNPARILRKNDSLKIGLIGKRSVEINKKL